MNRAEIFHGTLYSDDDTYCCSTPKKKLSSFNFDYHPNNRKQSKDFVKLHSEGLDNKENTDIFKHYQRLFKKNRYWQMKELLEKRAMVESQLKKKKEGDENSPGKKKNKKGSKTEEKKSHFSSLKLKDFIIEKNLADIHYYEKLSKEFMESKGETKPQPKANKAPIINERKSSIPAKSNKPEELKIVEPSYKIGEVRDMDFEENFLRNIADLIEKKGHFYVKREQMRIFKGSLNLNKTVLIGVK